ncbi:MAG: hypothetical protein IPJ23_05970 [Ignavibacteriales bacterium]|nr:hypothetical protein [Ignavibacteriales bacterium]
MILFIAFSETIITILTAGRYIAAQQYTNIALIAVFLMGVFSFFDKIFIALGKTKLNLRVNIIGGFSAIAVMYMAVKIINILGPHGKVVVSLIMVVTAGLLVKKHLKLQQVT